ncbi:MAG: HAD family hydrolase [Planctomycetota bacterium]|nr:HAD family hydrolase [Planctomycetota bacterium]
MPALERHLEMANAYEGDFRRRVESIGPTRFLPGTSIEIVREVRLAQPPRFVLLDFDGTLSLVREGWQSIMIPMMVELLQETRSGETTEALTRTVQDFVYELTGKQTVYQMIRLAEEIGKRGGRARDPLEYKKMYHDRLMARIHDRREALRNGTADPESMLVPGTLSMLRELQTRGVRMFLASGTDERYVLEEARLLTLDPFFGRHMYGALDDHTSFSKQMVIDRILRENSVPGASLLGFGDGFVEIDNVKSSGGIAVGVATDETQRSGRPDEWKRDRLIGVGADVIVPDFRESSRLIGYIWEGA